VAEVAFKNPFNGIERNIFDMPLDIALSLTNPFNGIEREHLKGSGGTPAGRIHSMELKGLSLILLLTSIAYLENPFNGIESCYPGFPEHVERSESIQWN